MRSPVRSGCRCFLMLQYFLQLNCFWKQRWMHTLTLRVNGVILETEFSFSSHGIKPAYYHLKNIAVISGLVSRQDLEKRVHAFISSRVGYCNGLLPKKRISSCRTLRTRTHLTPVLRSLYTIVMHIFKHRINEWLKRKSLTSFPSSSIRLRKQRQHLLRHFSYMKMIFSSLS